MTDQPTRKQRDLDRYRREILAAAVALFAEHGYHQTTMQTIAERAEFSVGYLYKHFAGKEDMYREVVRQHIDQLDAIIADARAQGLSPLAELHLTYTGICRHFDAHRDFMRIFGQEIGGDFPELASSRQRHLDDVVGLLWRAQQAGELGEVDVRLLGAAVHGMTRALFAELALRDGDRPFAGLPDLVFRLVLDPLRP